MGSATVNGVPAQDASQPGPALRFADVAVTATAKEFAGIYRNKQYHEPDFSAVLDRALEAGVMKVMLTGMSLSDVEFNMAIARSRPQQVRTTIGIHPYHASEPYSEEGHFDRLAGAVHDALKAKPSLLAAFGELGLDYDRTDRCPREKQIETFKGQLDLFVANKFDLPLFLHCRAAFDDFVEIIKEYLPHLPRRGLVHSFVGTTGQMQTLTSLGFDVSVNGFSFQDADSLEMVRNIPMDYLQIETDAPWGEITANSEVAKRYLGDAPPLPASKKRDKFEMGVMVKGRNESCCINRVALAVAGIKGISVEKVREAAWANSSRMFGLEEKDRDGTST